MLTIPGLLVFLLLDFLFPISHPSFPVELFRVCMYVCMILRVCSLVFCSWDFSSSIICISSLHSSFWVYACSLVFVVFLFNCFFSCSCSSVSFLIPKLSPSLVLVVLFPFLIPKLSLLQHDCQLLHHFLRRVQNKIFPRLI